MTSAIRLVAKKLYVTDQGHETNSEVTFHS